MLELTPKQKEVLLLRSRGRTSEDIAATLTIATWWNPDYNRPPLGKPVVRAPRSTRPPQPAHVTEQEVMQCIRTGMQTAGEIKQHLGLSREGVSRPLRSLYRAGRVKPVGKRMVGNGHGGRVVVWGLV